MENEKNIYLRLIQTGQMPVEDVLRIIDRTGKEEEKLLRVNSGIEIYSFSEKQIEEILTMITNRGTGWCSEETVSLYDSTIKKLLEFIDFRNMEEDTLIEFINCYGNSYKHFRAETILNYLETEFNRRIISDIKFKTKVLTKVKTRDQYLHFGNHVWQMSRNRSTKFTVDELIILEECTENWHAGEIIKKINFPNLGLEKILGILKHQENFFTYPRRLIRAILNSKKFTNSHLLEIIKLYDKCFPRDIPYSGGSVADEEITIEVAMMLNLDTLSIPDINFIRKTISSRKIDEKVLEVLEKISCKQKNKSPERKQRNEQEKKSINLQNS